MGYKGPPHYVAPSPPPKAILAAANTEWRLQAMSKVRRWFARRDFNSVDGFTMCAATALSSEFGLAAWQPWVILVVGLIVGRVVEGGAYNRGSK